jgi:DNA-binding NarL/FixJ family response regulator
MKMNAQEVAVERLSAATGFGRSARRVQEILPADIPGYLVPVVEALLSGQTDEAVCRRLGVSSRTFSRRVAELLEYLSVSTRFQGGAELVLRGGRDCGTASSAPVAQRAPNRIGEF